MRSVPDVYGPDMILKSNSGKVMAAAGMDYEGTLRHAGSTISICDETVYAKVRSAALEEEPEDEILSSRLLPQR